MSFDPNAAPLLDASIRVEGLPQAGRTLKVSANGEQREVLAGLLDVSAVEQFEAELLAKPFRGGIRVQGTLDAVVVQPCVVTFEPVRQTINETIDRIFLPGREKEFAGAAGAEVFVDLEGEELPDHFDGPEADLTDLLVETLSLAVDPYPRAPGASLEGVAADEASGEGSPFARLKVLKNNNGED
jgi:uncharacterized metal-binding protein YceD (DUF177 family)